MKKLALLIIGILLVATVTAGIIANRDKEIKLTKKEKNALTTVNLDEYEVFDYTKGTEEAERCLYKANAINTCNIFNTYYYTLKGTKVYFTEIELLNNMDDWEKVRMKSIANATSIRQNKVAKEKIREGITTITDK